MTKRFNFKEFQNDILNAHNKYREGHGSHPLILNENLNKSAQERAMVMFFKYFIKTISEKIFQ